MKHPTARPLRIAIIGISGSGKSRLARKLAQDTELPVFHMDSLFWTRNWQAVPEQRYLSEHAAPLDKDEWIIEGYIDEKMATRFAAAGLVIYLDSTGIGCLWRVIWRWLQDRRRARPELPTEAVERLQLQFLWTVLTRSERPNIEAAIRIAAPPRLTRVRGRAPEAA